MIRNKEKIGKLSTVTPYTGCAVHAPLVFVACYRKNCKALHYAQIDLSAAVENLLLEADALGLGAVWMGVAPLNNCASHSRYFSDELDAQFFIKIS